MKRVLLISSAWIAITISSCDFGTYVTINNYQGGCTTQVIYDKEHSNAISDNDTLYVNELNTKKKIGFLFRTETDSNRYQVVIPSKTSTILYPRGLNGHPIRSVEIHRQDSSILVINIRDRKQLKMLEEDGVIKIKGPIGNFICINNR